MYDPDTHDPDTFDFDAQDPNSDTPDPDTQDPHCPSYSSLMQDEVSHSPHHPDRKRSRSQSTTPSVHDHHHHYCPRQISMSSSQGSEFEPLRHVSFTGSAVSMPVQTEYHTSISKGSIPKATPYEHDCMMREAHVQRKKFEKQCILGIAVSVGVLTVIGLVIAFVLRNSLIIGRKQL